MDERRKLLEARTERFSLDVVKVLRTFSLESRDRPRSVSWQNVQRPLPRTIAHLADRDKEFTSKISQVAEEADESLFWLTLAQKIPLTDSPGLAMLVDEADQLTAIFTAMAATARETERKNAQERSAHPSI